MKCIKGVRTFLGPVATFISCKLANVFFKLTRTTVTQAEFTVAMSLTRESLLAVYSDPAHRDEINRLSDQKLLEINRYLNRAASNPPAETCTIDVELGHKLDTTKAVNAGTGGQVDSGGRGYRPGDIPKFASGVKYTVTLETSSITLSTYREENGEKKITGTYKFIQTGASISPSSADGSFV